MGVGHLLLINLQISAVYHHRLFFLMQKSIDSVWYMAFLLMIQDPGSSYVCLHHPLGPHVLCL